MDHHKNLEGCGLSLHVSIHLYSILLGSMLAVCSSGGCRNVFTDYKIKYAVMPGGVQLSDYCVTDIRNEEVFIMLLFTRAFGKWAC